MKKPIYQLSTLAFTILIFSTCSKEEIIYENQSLIKNVFPFQPRVQEFEITAGQNQTIEGEKGIQVFFPGNCFINQYGQPVTGGTVDVSMIEVTSKSDMILSGISTSTSIGILESGGMINLTAMQNGQELQLIPNSGVTIMIPTTNPVNGMSVYSASDNTGSEWELQPGGMVMTTTVGGISYYQMFSTDLNWINCDQPINFPQDSGTNVVIILPTGFFESNTDVFIVMSNTNSVVASDYFADKKIQL